MGLPVDDMELASLIEDEIGIIPMTNEYSDAIIEASMGFYSVRGALKGEVLVSNKDVAHFIAVNTKAALDEMGDAAMVAYLASSSVVRSLSEELVAIRVLEDLYLQGTGRAVRRWRESGLHAPAGTEESGILCDDLVLVDGDTAVAVIESKASMSGFRYPIRAVGKAVRQVVATLKHNEPLQEAWLLFIDLIGHNVLVHRADRRAWLAQDPRSLRRELRQAARAESWEGDPPVT